MSEQEILEGNKMIAEFMGIEIVKRNDEDAVFMLENAAFPEYFRCTKHNTYNSDWNLLMPVLEKIEALEYNVNVNGLACHIEKPNGEIICYSKQFEDKKATCYSAAKSFIRWYKRRVCPPSNNFKQ